MLLRRRIHRDPHLAAEHARIHVREAEKRPGIIRLEIDNLVIVARAHAQVSVERRIAADFARHIESPDAATTARQFQIESAQGFAVMAGDSADLEVEVKVLLLLLGLVSRASVDFTKFRPS